MSVHNNTGSWLVVHESPWTAMSCRGICFPLFLSLSLFVIFHGGSREWLSWWTTMQIHCTYIQRSCFVREDSRWLISRDAALLRFVCSIFHCCIVLFTKVYIWWFSHDAPRDRQTYNNLMKRSMNFFMEAHEIFFMRPPVLHETGLTALHGAAWCCMVLLHGPLWTADPRMYRSTTNGGRYCCCEKR